MRQYIIRRASHSRHHPGVTLLVSALLSIVPGDIADIIVAETPGSTRLPRTS
jgi:hypothetical protein